MELSPEEKKALEAEWAKGNKWGAALARQRAIATIVSSLVLALCLVPGLVLGSIRFILVGFIGGVAAGMAVRKALMPKGQFGGH